MKTKSLTRILAGPVAFLGLTLLPVQKAGAATYYWDVNGNGSGSGFSTVTGTWAAGNGFWNTDSTGGNGGMVTDLPTSADDLNISAGTTGTITISSTGTGSSLTISDNVPVAIAGGTLALGGTGAKNGLFVSSTDNSSTTVSSALTLNNGGVHLQNAGTGVLSFTGGITGSQDLFLENNGTTANGITISGAAVNNSGAVFNQGTGTGSVLVSAPIGSNVTGITQASGGTLILSGANTYAGTTTVSGGTLQAGIATVAGVSGAFGVNSATTVNTNSTLEMAGFDTTIGSLSDGGNGTNSFVQNTLNNAATLTIAGTNAAPVTYGGVIQDTAGTQLSLVKTGAGTQILSGANTYTGSTVIAGGTLVLAASGSINSGPESMTVGYNPGDNGSLTIAGGSLIAFDSYLGLNLGANGTATISSGNWSSGDAIYVGNGGTGTLNITGGCVTAGIGYLGASAGSVGTANISGGTWTNSNYLYVGESGTGTLNISGGCVNSPNGSIAALLQGSIGNVTVSGGTWNNGYSSIVGFFGTGTLNITDSGVVNVGDPLDPNPADRTLSLGYFAGAVGTLNLGNGGVAGTLNAAVVCGGAYGGTATVNFNQTGTYSFAPQLDAYLAVNKLGSGTTILTAVNSYAGATTVCAGTLEVTGTLGGTSALTGSPLGTSSVQVNSGGTLWLNSSTQASNIVGIVTGTGPANYSGSTNFLGNGGTLALGSGQSGTSQTFAMMTLSGNTNTKLDFSYGTGTKNTGVNLIFGGLDAATVTALIAGSTTLTINNWNGSVYAMGATADTGAFGDMQDRLIIGSTDLFGLGTPIAGIDFTGLGVDGTDVGGEEVQIGDLFEIVPVPEPCAALFGIALCGVSVLRRRRIA